MKGQFVFKGGTGFYRISRLLMLFLVAFGIVTIIANSVNQYFGVLGSMIVTIVASVGSVVLYNYSHPSPKPWKTEMWLALILIIAIYVIAKLQPTIFPLTFSIAIP